MKLLSLYLLAVIGLFAGCTKKTDSIFEKTPDERLKETLTGYQSTLASAPGWKLFVYPKGLENSKGFKVGGLTYYLKFDTSNRVRMVSDFVTDLAVTPKESGYRLKALQRPSLIFDTYNYMHIPADPDPSVSLSPTGTGGYGWGTDFNFSFTAVAPKDTMILQGNFNKSAAVLVKATQAEMDAAFTRGRLRDIINFTADYPYNYPLVSFLATSTQRVYIGLDLNNYIITFSRAQGTSVAVTDMAFSHTTYGLHLMSPVTFGNYTFQDIYWDDAKRVYYILSGTTHIEFTNAPVPLATVPLTNVIGGSQYTYISIPPGASTPTGATLPGESPLFLTRYNTIQTQLLGGQYKLTLDEMDFVFDASLRTMDVYVFLYQGTDGPYVALFSYTYTVDASGYYKFTRVSQNANAALIATSMNNLLSYIDNEQFRLEGFSSSYSFMGRFTSRQTPDFFFSGYLY